MDEKYARLKTSPNPVRVKAPATCTHDESICWPMQHLQKTAISLDAVLGWVCTVCPSFRRWGAEMEEVKLYGQTLRVFSGWVTATRSEMKRRTGGKCCAVHFLQENIIKISKDREQLADNWLYGREVEVGNQYLLAAIKTKSSTDT